MIGVPDITGGAVLVPLAVATVFLSSGVGAYAAGRIHHRQQAVYEHRRNGGVPVAVALIAVTKLGAHHRSDSGVIVLPSDMATQRTAFAGTPPAGIVIVA